jgi:hypothetical protein
MRLRLLILVIALAPVCAFAQTPIGSGLNVTVTRAGQPVANAVVCVGVSNDLNQFFQGSTDAQGRVNAGAVPTVAYVVTARAGDGGAQQSFAAPASPAGIPLLSITVPVPATGGPSCPTTPAGPQRTLISPNITLPPPTTLPTPIRLLNNQRCFGALGNQCGQGPAGIPLTALCANGRCFVNPGSWDHDECCFRNPNGMACNKGPLDALTGHDGNCVTSWNKALRLVGKGLNWPRNVDFTRNNSTGTVEFNLYCAPANALLPPGDAAKCCSGLTRALNISEAAAALAVNETLAACR